jgi:hypothetical protein
MLQVIPSIKILFLSANPIDTDRLSLDKEFREISQKVRGSKYRDLLQLVSVWAARTDDLLQALNEHQPHIVHFSGHGSTREEILLVDDQGKSRPVSDKALEILFNFLKDNIRIVILNSCYSQKQAEIIASSIDCVVGMSNAISDAAAICFAASFYEAIGFGRSVSEAFGQGIVALLLRGISEENTPKLLVRPGVNAAKVYLVQVQSSSEETTNSVESEYQFNKFKQSPKSLVGLSVNSKQVRPIQFVIPSHEERYSFNSKKLEEFLWNNFPDFTSRIGIHSGKQWHLRRSIYKDIKAQFQSSPLCFPQTMMLAEKRHQDVFPHSNNPLSEDNFFCWDQLVWNGWQQLDLISALRDIQHPIRINVHTMMIAAIVTLLSLKTFRGIQLEINWDFGTSSEQINQLANNKEICDFLLTADAGTNYANSKTLSDYSRLFTCIEETQYVIAKRQALEEGISLVYFTPGTTQQIHYELWSNESRLPKDKIELRNISDTPFIAQNISSKEALILTRQKSRRFLKEHSLTIIGKEKRGLSFSLYHHNSWYDEPLLLHQFIRAFLTEWNFCRTAFLNRKLAESGLQDILNQMWHSGILLNAYSIASNFELFHKGD